MISQQLPRIVASLKAPAPRPHDASFHIAPDTCGGWRIFDGPRALAHFAPTYLDIWAFSPFEPDIMAHAVRNEHVRDLHTVHNTWINFGAHGWPARWKQADAKNPKSWQWEQDSGPQLRVRVTLDGGDGEGAVWLISVSYDPERAQYRFEYEIEARKADPNSLEILNLMASGALVANREDRRWTHSISENAEGNLRRIVHSNAIFLANGLYTQRNTTHPSTWVGYASHPTFNPAILVHRTSTPMQYATCDQLFDEHLIWRDAGQDDYEADGMFHFRLSAEIVNIPAALAAELLSAAADPVPWPSGSQKRLALPFSMDVVNSFEKKVDIWAPVECAIIVVREDTSEAEWAHDVAHTGTRSIKLNGSGARNEIFPVGAVLIVEPQTRYRLTGWIRTRNVAEYARLELASYAYTYSNIIDHAESLAVSGDSEWTQVEAILDSGEQSYLMPRLVLQGSGEAWFNDIQLTKA